MRVLVTWMLTGIMLMAACRPLPVPSPMEGTPDATQIVVAQTEVPAPSPTDLSSRLQTEKPGEATSPETTSVLPLPTATIPAEAFISPVENPVISRAQSEGQVPGKLTEIVGEAALVYERSGGFAGTYDRWVIYPDGRIEAADGQEWQVTPEQVEQLIADIEAQGFFEMERSYMPLNTCCDRFVYELTVSSGERTNQVSTIDGAPDAPQALWEILAILHRFIAEGEEK